MDNLIIKFSKQNLCSEKHIEEFLVLPLANKVVFTNAPSDNERVVYIPGYEQEEYVKDDISSYKKHMDILEFVNTGKVVKK